MTGLTNDVRRDLRGALLAHERLTVDLSGLTDEMVQRPSLLPGWTVAHTLTHIARNADSHVRILRAACEHRVVEQYEGGGVARSADIEAGATRGAAALLADIVSSSARLEQTWIETSEVGWAGRGIMPNSGHVSCNDLPFRRWREVVVHLHDCGLGYSWRDWPDDYVRLELSRMTMEWASRKPMGLTTLPATALALGDRERVAWLLGRTSVVGLDVAGIF